MNQRSALNLAHIFAIAAASVTGGVAIDATVVIHDDAGELLKRHGDGQAIFAAVEEFLGDAHTVIYKAEYPKVD